MGFRMHYHLSVEISCAGLRNVPLFQLRNNFLISLFFAKKENQPPLQSFVAASSRKQAPLSLATKSVSAVPLSCLIFFSVFGLKYQANRQRVSFSSDKVSHLWDLDGRKRGLKLIQTQLLTHCYTEIWLMATIKVVVWTGRLRKMRSGSRNNVRSA